MANIPLKTLTFPGLDDTYTIPQVDNTLATAGDAADAKKTGDEISQIKADLDDINVRVTDLEVGGGGGSGGSSTLVGLTDTSISNKTDGQVLTYDNESHKWINKTPDCYTISQIDAKIGNIETLLAAI